MCGGSNLSTDLLLWGIYIKTCISPVRICLQSRKARNASTKFRKTSALKKAEKSLEISRFLVFSMLHLNQTRIMCLQANSDADFVLANLDAARWHTSPLVKQELASDSDLPGLQNHACKQNYVIISPLNSSISPINTFCPVSRGNRLYCRKTSKRRYSQ